MRLLTFGALMALAATSARAQSPTILGLTLGGPPPSYGVCEGHPPSFPCLFKRSDTEFAVMSQDPPRPEWVQDVMIEELNGNIGAIIIGTGGMNDQALALSALTTKFGKPTTSTTESVHNGYGASFAKAHAVWKAPGYTVDFEGIGASTDSGLVMITTPAYDAQQAKAEAAKNPPL